MRNKSQLEKPVTTSSIGIPDGTNTGDIIRWNATTGAWEVAVEPLEFTQINLTPSVSAIEDVEGGIYYNSVDKSVYVCTDI